MQRRKIVVSYAREDVVQVEALVDLLEELGHEVWRDTETPGGQRWWDVILAHVRAADLVVAAVSPAMGRSSACAAERRYATDLRRAILPVAVDTWSADALPADLADVHLVDLSEQAEARTAVARLARSLQELPAADPLPEPLPEPPGPPRSPLHELRERIRTPQLDRSTQLGIVTELQQLAAVDDVDPGEVLDAAHELGDREDLYHRAAAPLQELIAELGSGTRRAAGRRGSPAHPPRQLWQVLLWESSKHRRKIFVLNLAESIDLEFPVWRPTTVKVGWQKVPLRRGIAWSGPGSEWYRFEIPAGGRRCVAEIRTTGLLGLTGFLLLLDGDPVYADGALEHHSPTDR